MGDVLAAAPIVKWAIDRFHKDGRYKVLAIPQYRDIFEFVPDSHFGDQRGKHTFQNTWQIRYLNTPRSANARTTSMRMHLSEFASIQLTDRIIPEEERRYLPLPTVEIGHFGLDPRECVFIIVTYRDETRRIPFETVLEISEYVVARGLKPVYIGREDDDPMWKDNPFRLSFDKLPDCGVSLLNKTSMLEMASLFRDARCVVGMDSGPIHVAGTTGGKVPIVCGFTTVAPEHRIPLRERGLFISVVPESLPCRHCQSHWMLSYHNFGTCYFGHMLCVKRGMTGEAFVKALRQVFLKKE